MPELCVLCPALCSTAPVDYGDVGNCKGLGPVAVCVSGFCTLLDCLEVA